MASNDQRDDDERRATTHALIRSVVEERGGYPAHRSKTEGQGDHGLLVVADRDDETDHEEITWEQFFEEFEEKDLIFVYPDDPEDGEVGSLVGCSGQS